MDGHRRTVSPRVIGGRMESEPESFGAVEPPPCCRPLEALLVGLGVTVVLFVLVAATIAAFDRVDRRAAALLVPCLLWVGFAAVLNYQFWRLN
jgi:tryptophan-rich sensory protein